MTAKEYLRQAYRLDHKINSDIEEAARLREMASSIGSPGFDEHYNSNRPTEASFVRCLGKVWELEQKISTEIGQLVDLKEQIRCAIDSVDDVNEQMVLRYRYIHNMTWEQIGDRLHTARTTAYRWHGSALRHIVLPENPIVL